MEYRQCWSGPQRRRAANNCHQLLRKARVRLSSLLSYQLLSHSFDHDFRHAFTFEFGELLDKPNGLVILDVECSHRFHLSTIFFHHSTMGRAYRKDDRQFFRRVGDDPGGTTRESSPPRVAGRGLREADESGS